MWSEELEYLARNTVGRRSCQITTKFPLLGVWNCQIATKFQPIIETRVHAGARKQDLCACGGAKTKKPVGRRNSNLSDSGRKLGTGEKAQLLKPQLLHSAGKRRASRAVRRLCVSRCYEDSRFCVGPFRVLRTPPGAENASAKARELVVDCARRTGRLSFQKGDFAFWFRQNSGRSSKVDFWIRIVSN